MMGRNVSYRREWRFTRRDVPPDQECAIIRREKSVHNFLPLVHHERKVAAVDAANSVKSLF